MSDSRIPSDSPKAADKVIEITHAHAYSVRSTSKTILILCIVALVSKIFYLQFYIGCCFVRLNDLALLVAAGVLVAKLTRLRPFLNIVRSEKTYKHLNIAATMWFLVGLCSVITFLVLMGQARAAMMSQGAAGQQQLQARIAHLRKINVIIGGVWLLRDGLFLVMLVFIYKLFRVFAKVFAHESVMDAARTYIAVYVVLKIVAMNMYGILLWSSGSGGFGFLPFDIITVRGVPIPLYQILLVLGVMLLSLAAIVFIVLFLVRLYRVHGHIRPVTRSAAELFD
jgi:hypothetical protein